MKPNRAVVARVCPIIVVTGIAWPLASSSHAQHAQDAPASVMAQTVRGAAARSESADPHALQDSSMFAIAPPEIRIFKKHDLVQIIVRESSRAESTQELETKKVYELDGSISAWPAFDLSDLLELRLFAGRNTDLPKIGVDFQKDFQGEGDYKREDDFTARLSAEIIDILPNNNLVLEARTYIKTDEEESMIKVTGVCRPDDVSPANTLLSNHIHDLKIVKMHEGELKRSSEKGIIAKILDTIFAF